MNNDNRSQGVGGSEVAAILGIDPFKTAYDVWNSKVNGVRTDETYIMKRGTFMEEFIAREFANAFNAVVWKPSSVLTHPTISFLYASIDRFYKLNDGNNTTGVLECKDTTKLISEPIPAHYIQVQWYMMISKLQNGYLAYNTPFEAKYFEIKSDANFQQMLITKVVDFWNNFVMTKTPPPAHNLDDVKAIYKEVADGKIVVANDNVKDLLIKILQLKNSIKQKEVQIEEHERQLFEFFGDAEIIIDDVNDVLATWKATETTRFDIATFKKEHPELVANYLKTTSTRRLNITNKGIL